MADAVAYDVRELRRTPSLRVVGAAWVTYRVTVRCEAAGCASTHDASVDLSGSANAVDRDRERDEHHPRAAIDAAASALAARWAFTSRGALRCPLCRTARDVATVAL